MTRPPATHDSLRLLTVVDVAERLSLSRSKVYALMATGDLPFVHIGRNRRIRLIDFESYLTRLTVTDMPTTGLVRLSRRRRRAG
jgi:excisionase family DNA binding protein